MNNNILYEIALTMVPNIGTVQAKLLVDSFGDAESVFKASRDRLTKIEGIGSVRATEIKNFTNFSKAEEEINFIRDKNIQALFITHEQYPKRLLNCFDPPTMLYYKGTATLNASKVVAIVGTRMNTEYGKMITEALVQGLPEDVLVLSGMAYGIDVVAHKAALKCEKATVGIVAHGMDMLYPPQHKNVAYEMLQNNGGLLTEFRKGVKPDKYNFPARNRIVAGMSDCVIIVETEAKGGSMITAELAYDYNKDVFAVPGKLTDIKSSGCLQLIAQNKAVLYYGVDALMENIGWKDKKTATIKQRQLFIDLSEDEKIIVEILKEKNTVHVDEIYLKSKLSSSAVAAGILNLELQDVILSLPGKMYQLM